MILMRSLVEQLNQASDVYYNGKGELMTDYEWDTKFDQLKKLEEETGEVLPDSPTNKVSEDSIVGQKEEHEFAALSLAKTKLVSDLLKWAENRPIWISNGFPSPWFTPSRKSIRGENACRCCRI